MANENVQKYRELIADAFDYKTVLCENKIEQGTVNNVRQILLSIEFVPKAFSDKMLLIFLIAADKDIKKCIEIVKNYCNIVKDSPEWFYNRNVQSDKVQKALDNQDYFSLPPTPQNYNVVYHKLSNHEPNKYLFDDACKTIFMTVGKKNK